MFLYTDLLSSFLVCVTAVHLWLHNIIYVHMYIHTLCKNYWMPLGMMSTYNKFVHCGCGLGLMYTAICVRGGACCYVAGCNMRTAVPVQVGLPGSVRSEQQTFTKLTSLKIRILNNSAVGFFWLCKIMIQCKREKCNK